MPPAFRGILMITISLCMIVKNEEKVLERCLKSVEDLVDEIIIVDTGSEDKTVEIAKQFTSNVHTFQWIDDFSAARNYSFSLSKMEYSLWLDADDIIKEDDRNTFKKLKESLPKNINVVMMKYNTGFDEYGNPTFSYFRERVIKNNSGMAWKGAIHEVIEPIGEVYYSDCAISHKKISNSDPERNLRIFETQIKKGVILDPRQQFYYGRELYYNKKFELAIDVFEDFLNNGNGWIENNIDACCHCAYCQYELKKPEKALISLMRSFSYDLPRAEVCCDIGKHFLDQNRYKEAAFWYSIALTCHRDDRRGGFYSPDCYDYIPCIQLCVCYSNLGKMEQAIKFNELAASFKPNSPAVIYNREYFIKQKEGMPIF